MTPPKWDRLGLRTRHRFPPTLFADVARRLEALGDTPETAAARAEVDAVLAQPWWGQRILALRVIGRWGGKRNKAWLMERAGRPLAPMDGAARNRSKARRWLREETFHARQLVQPLLDGKDAEWLLGVWWLDREAEHGWWGVYRHVPFPMRAAAAKDKLRHGDAERREAAARLLATCLDDPDCHAMMSALTRDHDFHVARTAELRLRWHGWHLRRTGG